MDVQTFVREILVQIAKGVHDAIDAVRKLSGAVNPFDPSNGFPSTHPVQFDIAITVTESREISGEAKFKLSVLGVAAEGSKLDSTRQVSRVKFAVPCHLPYTDTR
jgi:hypothetical protein